MNAAQKDGAAIHAFFDESYGANLFCVAGYIFKKSKLKEFRQRWRLMLTDFGLPYFRMSACAHGNEPFKALTKAQRIEVEKRAIKLICKYASRGISACIDVRVFDTAYSPNGRVSTPYETCVWTVLQGVRGWKHQTSAMGKVAFQFEAGAGDQRKASILLSELFSKQELVSTHAYSSHGFVDKRAEPAVQAADLIAWQMFTEAKRLTNNPTRPVRADFLALYRGLKHDFVIYDETMMRNLMARLAGHKYAL